MEVPLIESLILILKNFFLSTTTPGEPHHMPSLILPNTRPVSVVFERRHPAPI